MRDNSTTCVDVEACLSEIEALTQTRWWHGIRLKIEVDPDLPLLECDPAALQNAVLNLLLNAHDAMPGGGVVSIRAEATSLGSGVMGVELSVADNGMGMKPDTIERAFDPFFTTKPDGLGGVGLPIVRRFAEEAGGSVVIESNFGIGTVVKLRVAAP
jgi:signal transduction histidine kinase